MIFGVSGAHCCASSANRAPIRKPVSMLAVVLFATIWLFGCEPVINKMAFHPDTRNVIHSSQLPRGVQELFIETEDRLKIQCYFISSKQSEKIIIYFHGNAGNIGHRLPDLMQLNRIGLNVLGVSYRGYGRSQGKPSEAGIYMDGDAAFRHATGELGFAVENVFVLGRSIGTSVAIHVSQKQNMGGLVLVTPLTSGAEQAKASGLGLVSFVAGDSFNNIGKIGFVSCPVLVIHGTRDNIIPISMGKDIYAKTEAHKKFVAIEGAGHNNLSTTYAGNYWPPIKDFLKSLL